MRCLEDGIRGTVRDAVKGGIIAPFDIFELRGRPA
jgi:hypothetical protein